MTPATIGFWLCAAGLALPASSPPSDLHLVVESQFNYLASVRTTTTDMWMSTGRRTAKIGETITIRREDLGIRWRINLKAGTYTEEKIEPPSPPPPPAKEDIHTVGQNYYEPEFDWTLSDSGQKTTIAGRPCRQFLAAGDADYAESTVKFWVCEPIAGITHPVNDAVISQMRNQSARKMVEQATAKQGSAWVLGIEETQEHSIAPTMVITVSVKTLDATAAPPGTFELPANAKKAAR